MKEIELLEYSNPRLSAIIEGWPWGREKRTQASFFIESNKRGQRAGRILKDPQSGRPCATKFTTYSAQARIVDGSDGRTYIATLGHFNSSLQIVCGDMKYTREYPPAGNAGTPEHERHAKILALFSAEALTQAPKGAGVVQRNEARGGCILNTSDALDGEDFGGAAKLDKERADILAEANAEGRDITLSEGLDFLRGEGVQVVVLDNPDTVAEQLDAAFGKGGAA